MSFWNSIASIDLNHLFPRAVYCILRWGVFNSDMVSHDRGEESLNWEAEPQYRTTALPQIENLAILLVVVCSTDHLTKRMLENAASNTNC